MSLELPPLIIPSFRTLPSDTTYEEAYREYWGLGVEDCWKQQGIDGRDHHHGKWVYDLGKHKKGTKEPGYWESTFAAMEFVSRPDVLMEDLSVKLYQEIHKVACRHFDIQSKEQAGKEAIGGFFKDRTPNSGRGKCYIPLKTDLICSTPEENASREQQLKCAMLFDALVRPTPMYPYPVLEYPSQFEYYFLIFKEKNPGLYGPDATVKQFTADYKKATLWLKSFSCESVQKMIALNAYIKEKSEALGLTDPVAVLGHDPQTHSTFLNSPRVLLSYKCTEEKLEPLVARLFAEYNEKMKVAATREDRLRNIAELFQMLEWIHPFADGQGRTDWLILNKELCRWGFTPAILDDPYVSSMCSLEEWIAYLEEGMKRWQKERDALMASAVESLTFFV